MNIRRATISDLMEMQNCNIHNLPEVSSHSSRLLRLSVPLTPSPSSPARRTTR